MQYTVFVIILLVLIVVGVVLAFTGDLEEKLKDPLYDSLENYDPESNNSGDEALVKAWDEFQRDVSVVAAVVNTDLPKGEKKKLRVSLFNFFIVSESCIIAKKNLQLNYFFFKSLLFTILKTFF